MSGKEYQVSLDYSESKIIPLIPIIAFLGRIGQGSIAGFVNMILRPVGDGTMERLGTVEHKHYLSWRNVWTAFYL